MKTENIAVQPGSFYLDKWFLDFVGPDGEIMIFYAAKLRWKGWEVPYTNWLHYDPQTGMRQTSRFRQVNMPRMEGGIITWEDAKFGVKGSWEQTASSLQTYVFESEEGALDWKCHQPASKVRLEFQNRTIEGVGYGEQLILTVPAWKIPMHELRWGRFGSATHQMVWIELRETSKKQWLWLNGERIENCRIDDDCIELPDQNLVLQLDRAVVLESEQKIFSVVESLLRFIPGFNKIMPLQFLMAQEHKWASNAVLVQGNKIVAKGTAIHELVNFNAP